MHLGIQRGGQRCFLHNLYGCRHLGGGCLGDVILTEVGVFVDVQLGVGRVADGKTGVGAGKTMLMDVQTVQLLLFGNTQPDRLLDD